MNPSLERILINLTGKNDLQQISLEELEKIAEEHPYFSIAHLLVAKKSQAQQGEQHEGYRQAAALYYSNTWWLHQLLTSPDETVAANVTSTANAGLADDNSKVTNAIHPQIFPPKPANEIVPVNDREKVVLTDGDDNVLPETLLLQDKAHAKDVIVEDAGPTREDTYEGQPTTLSAGNTEETVEVVADNTLKNENGIIDEDSIDKDPRFVEENEEEQEQASTFSTIKKPETGDDEILHAQNEEEEILTAGRIEETEINLPPVNPTPGGSETQVNNEEIVPITTEFTTGELLTADNLAHSTLAEETAEATRTTVFALPGNEEPPLGEVPITTEFTRQEIDESSRLAHEALTESSTEPIGQPLFALPVVHDDEVEKVLHEQTSADVIREITNDVQPGNLPAISKITEPEIQDPLRKPAQPGDQRAVSIDHDEQEANNTDFEMPEASPDDFTNNQMLQNIKSILDTPLTSNSSAEKSLIPIDPYYTVDYFASQGIKLVLDNEPTDKLGKKLKKFTQWLKHMKKLGPEDAAVVDAESDADSEATVIRIADFSNTQREIITEAMALVLEKQGKKENAIQIYIKLSFLHPDKSAYFADKIKILKGIK